MTLPLKTLAKHHLERWWGFMAQHHSNSDTDGHRVKRTSKDSYMNDRFIELRLDKLIRQILHDHLGQPITRNLMDQIEVEVFTKCGWAVPVTLDTNEEEDEYIAEPCICWVTPNGSKNYIHFQELL